MVLPASKSLDLLGFSGGCNSIANTVADLGNRPGGRPEPGKPAVRIMTQTPDHPSRMRLHDPVQRRLYINAAERLRFCRAAQAAPIEEGLFAEVLLFTGCRISEALALTADAIEPEVGAITFRTLKRRRGDVFREVPVPMDLTRRLARLRQPGQESARAPLWALKGTQINRVTAYRWIKAVMGQAGIRGAQACPKGLRHGFGIHAIRCGVPLNMLQKWMGHASMSTTAIYANAIGAEERAVAARMWDEKDPSPLGGTGRDAQMYWLSPKR